MHQGTPQVPKHTHTHTHTRTFLFIDIVYKTPYGFPNKTEDVLMLRTLWQNLRICQSTINTIYLFIRHVRTVCCLWATRWLTLSCNKWRGINTSTFRGHQLFVYNSVFVDMTSYESQRAIPIVIGQPQSESVKFLKLGSVLTVMQDVHVRLYQGLSRQEHHSTRNIIFSEANLTSI